MTARPLGLFDQEIRQRKLQALGDPLVAAEHHRALGHVPRDAADDAHGGPGSAQGRPPPHDAVRMFKVLVLRELYARSDDWTQKHDRSWFGYKNHINADVMHGFIRDYAVTPAATHDSQALPELLDITQRGQPLYAELGEDPRAGRTRIRAPRPVPQGPAAALHGLGARRGGDRADQLRAQPAAAGDDGAAAAAGARARADEVSAQGTCAWSRAIRGSGRSGRQQQRHSPRCAVSRNRSGGMRQVQNRFFKLLTTRTYGVSGSGDLQVWLTHEWMLLCSRFTLARCGFRFRPLSRSRR